MRGLERIGPECFGSGFAFLVSLALFSRFLQRLYEQDAVFGIFRLAFGGFAEGSGSGGEITRLQSEQAEIERIIVLIGIKIGGAAKLRLGLGGFAAAGMGNCKIV